MKIIFGFLASLAMAQDISHIAKLALDFKERYSFSWTAVLFKGAEVSRAFSIGKMLMMSLDERITIKSITTYVNNNEEEGTNHGRSFYLVLGDKVNLREELKQLSYSISVEETIWLIFLDEKTNLEEYFKDVNIVYNMDMLVVQPLPDGTKKVTEVYRIAKEHPVRMLNYGVWSVNRGLKSKVPALFCLRRQNLEGINFKVAGKKKTAKTAQQIGHEYGILGIVWNDLELKLNFTSTYTSVNESEIFLPGGVFAIMNREKLDAALIEITMSQDSCSAIRCLRPIVMTKNRLYLKKTRLNILWDSVLKPFHTETWITILLWFVVSSIGLEAFLRMSRKYGFEEGPLRYDVLDSALTVFNAVCQKGSVTMPDSVPCRVLFFVSYSVATVLFTVYSASLASFLTVQEPYFPFENLRQLLEDGTHSLQPIRYSDLYMDYANATDAFSREVFAKLIPDGDTLPGNKKEGLNRVCMDEKIVYLGSEFKTKKAVLDVNKNGHCEIISPAEPLNTVYITILLSKSSQFKELFNVQLNSLILAGLVYRNMKRADVEMGIAEEKTFSGVGLHQLLQIYAILILGMISSFFILAIENFAYKTFKKKKSSVSSFRRRMSLPSVSITKKAASFE